MAEATTAPNPVALNPNEIWRGFTIRATIPACKLGKEDLKRLYRLINEKQIEYGERIVGQLWQTTEETPEQFQTRCLLIKNAFITTVMITSTNGDSVTGHGESIFDSSLVPEQIKSILYDTSFSPSTQLQHTPNDKVSLFLDFSRPPFLNFSVLPAAPTPNESNWSVSAGTESWFTSLCTRLQQFFTPRATQRNWLHGSGAYDLLLLVAGIPLALWGDYRLGNAITAGKALSSTLSTAIYVYLFFLLLNIFRLLFLYARWIFPKLELESKTSTTFRSRAILSVLILGVLASALWDGIKALW